MFGWPCRFWASTFTATSQVEAATISVRDVLTALDRDGQLSVEEIIAFLQQLPSASHLGAKDMTKLASLMLLKRFSTNDVVVKQGDEANMLYFIRWVVWV